jgi:hypothetical protein
MDNAIKLLMPVTKSEGSKRVPVGEVELFVPTLAAFGIEATPSAQPEGDVPTYGSNELNWLQNAIKNATLANARNKLVPKTTQVRDGAKLPTTLEELTEPSILGGNPDALRAVAELKRLFREHVAGLGKSAKVQALLVGCFDSVKALAMQSADIRTKIAGYLEEFVGTMIEAGAEPDGYQTAYLERLLEACADEEALDLDEL